MKGKIRRKVYVGGVQLLTKSRQKFWLLTCLSPSFILIFLASGDWPGVTEWWWPSLRPADGPVNVVNQPVTCCRDTGGAAEKCWYAKSQHLKPHQLCRTRIGPDAAISWKRRNPAGQQRRGLKINAALKWLCWQSRLESEHPTLTSPSAGDQQKNTFWYERWH